MNMVDIDAAVRLATQAYSFGASSYSYGAMDTIVKVQQAAYTQAKEQDRLAALAARGAILDKVWGSG